MTSNLQDPATTERCDLPVVGMTCASCAARIETGLAGLPGVERGHVNFATNRATVTYDPAATGPGSFRATVAGLGYSVPDVEPSDPEADELRDLRPRLAVAVGLGIPVVAISMVPALQFSGWQWVVFALVDAGDPLGGVAVPPRHVGEPAPPAPPPWTRSCRWAPWPRTSGPSSRWCSSAPPTRAWRWVRCSVARSGGPHVYFETASAIVALLLLGKYFEARARGRSSDAIRALLELGAKTATLENGDEIPVGEPARRRPLRGATGREHRHRRRRRRRRVGLDVSMLTGEPVPVDVEAGDDVFGATLNTSGRLVVRGHAVGADTALAQIARLVEQAQGAKAPVQRLADRISAVFVPWCW